VKLTDLTLDGMDAPYGRLEPFISFVPEIGPQETIEVPFRFVFFGFEEQQQGGARNHATWHIPQVNPDDATAFADCVTGGFGGLLNAYHLIRHLQATAAARGYCPAGDINLEAAFAVIMAAQLFNVFGSGADFIINFASCVAQAIFGKIGGGSRGGGRATGGGGGVGTGFGVGGPCPGNGGGSRQARADAIKIISPEALE
jgi:hypothetical protein